MAHPSSPDQSGYPELFRVSPKTSDLNDFFECLEAEGVSLVSAHRGGTPENSIEGMQSTLSTIPAVLEIDVATSKDGVLFLMHDDTLDRTTNATGVVSETNWEIIKSARLRDDDGKLTQSHPPRFSDVLAWASKKTILQIDIKQSTRYEDIVNEVIEQNATHRIVYIAYSAAQASKLHRLHPEAMISVSIEKNTDLTNEPLSRIPRHKMLAWTGNTKENRGLFRYLNDRDIEVIFGTLGGRNSIDQQIDISGNQDRYSQIATAGVDIIASDQPVDVIQNLKANSLPVVSPQCGVTAPR